MFNSLINAYVIVLLIRYNCQLFSVKEENMTDSTILACTHTQITNITEVGIRKSTFD